METPRLPPELYNLILANLNVNDLLTCRRVNKLFRVLVDQIRIHSLAISKEENAFSYRPSGTRFGPGTGYCEDFIWQFHNCTEHQALACRTLKSSSLKTLKALNLSQLRQLIIHRIEIRSRSSFEPINRLEHLEYLEISLFHLYCNLEIAMPNLRTFKTYDSVGPTNYAVRFTTPSLTNLKTVCFQFSTSMGPNKLRFKHPETLRRLSVRACDRPMTENLRNLEYFECYFGHFINCLELFRFQSLKALNCGELTIHDMLGILEQRKNRKMNFDLFFRGIKLNHANELRQDLVDELTDTNPNPNWRHFKPFSARILFANYADLFDSPLPMANSLSYEDFVEHFPSGAPENFSVKFFNVRELSCANRIERPEHFVALIRNFRHLEKVKLINSGLKDQFYIRYLHLFSRITELHIFDQPKMISDLAIVFRFKKLERFCTNQQVYQRLILDLFENLQNFKYVQFTFREQTYDIDCFDRQPNQHAHQIIDTAQVSSSGSAPVYLSISEIPEFLMNIFG